MTWPGENCALKAFVLPPHRLVGELSHPVELLLHLVFSAFTPTRGGYSALLLLSTHRSVLQRGAAQNPGSRHVPSLQSSDPQKKKKKQLFLPRLHLFTGYVRVCARLGGPAVCAGMLERFTAGHARRQRHHSSDKKRLRSGAMWEM